MRRKIFYVQDDVPMSAQYTKAYNWGLSGIKISSIRKKKATKAQVLEVIWKNQEGINDRNKAFWRREISNFCQANKLRNYSHDIQDKDFTVHEAMRHRSPAGKN